MDTMLGKFDLYHNKKFEMSADIFLPENSQNSAIELVSSVTYHSRTYMYYRFPVNFSNLQPNKWNHVAFKFVLPDVSNKKARFKVYVWNNSKIIAFIDNLCVKTFIRNPFQTFGIK
jgi:hypothetical protein